MMTIPVKLLMGSMGKGTSGWNMWTVNEVHNKPEILPSSKTLLWAVFPPDASMVDMADIVCQACEPGFGTDLGWLPTHGGGASIEMRKQV